MDPTERLEQLLGGAEPSLPLDETALCVAAHAHPGLDVDAYLARLDDLAEGVRQPTLDGLRRHLFADLGFRGNHRDYFDPRNSYLDDVLDRRIGIPITLSIVLMEVGRRIGVPLAGVSMPGHFLVRDKVDPSVFVDAYAGGVELDRAGCEARFHDVLGEAATFHDGFLAPVGRRAIPGRLLANLDTIAERRADLAMSEWVRRLRTLLPEATIDDHRRHAAALAARGRFDEAAAALEAAADRWPDADGTSEARTGALRLRAQLN